MSEFKLATEYIKKGSFKKQYKDKDEPDNQQQLIFYAYYKISTLGPASKNPDKKPSALDLMGKAKWDAWVKAGDISKEEAEKKYVEELKKIAPDFLNFKE